MSPAAATWSIVRACGRFVQRQLDRGQLRRDAAGDRLQRLLQHSIHFGGDFLTLSGGDLDAVIDDTRSRIRIGTGADRTRRGSRDDGVRCSPEQNRPSRR